MERRSLEFTEFYNRSRDRCLLTVLASVGDRDLAQELVAEAFARAWAAWSTVSRHPSPEAWVVRTALNVSVSRWRRYRREVLLSDPQAAMDPSTAAQLNADSTIDPRLMDALMGLPVRQREVVALRVFLDLDTSRTAEVLGIARGTVQAHLGRAMATLRHELILKPQQEEVQ